MEFEFWDWVMLRVVSDQDQVIQNTSTGDDGIRHLYFYPFGLISTN